MKIFISPAKSMDLSSEMPSVKESQPYFVKEAISLNNILKGKTPKSLASLKAQLPQALPAKNQGLALNRML